MKDRSLETRFQRAKINALQRAESVLSHWLPDGKPTGQGQEYLVKNPVRGEKNPSLSVNRGSGAWYDFASGDKGGDLISLVAYLEGCRPSQALERLEAFLGLATNDNHPLPSKSANSPAVSDDWEPVAPVPHSALQAMPEGHSRYGVPSNRWEYHDAECRLLMVVDRFDLVKGKQFAPLTYWRNNATGEEKWQRKGLPESRPLLYLERLAADPTAPVVVTEGEKAADAAALLFPDHIATCWPNGANAVGKVDFSPLIDRHVILWADNDPPGIKCMEDLASKLQALGTASVRLINLSAFESGAVWQEKDDAADLVDRGWTAKDLLALATKGVLYQDPPPTKSKGGIKRKRQPDAQPTPGFALKESGLYAIPQDGDPRRVCEPLEIIAQTRDERGRRWGLLVEFKDPDGVTKRHNIHSEALISEGAKDAISPLLDMGLKLDPRRQARNTKHDLISYLQGYAGNARARLVDRLGWHGDAYLLPSKAFGDAVEHLEFIHPEAELPSIEEAGTLDEWKQHIGAFCPGNDRLTLLVCTGLAAPLLHPLGLESGGFHIYGTSSGGKTTLLDVAASVYGSPKLVRSWRTTDNALESIAAAHSDGLLVLDEIGMCNPRIIGEVAYMLGSGTGKARANDRGDGKPVRRWRLLFLSSGEKTLAEHMDEGNQAHRAGMDVRMMGIPADAGAGMGVFQELHGFGSAADLADHLKGVVSRYYGTPLTALLEKLTEPDNVAQLIKLYPQTLANFCKETLPPKASGQARRAAARFALVAMAGEWATKWGVTGWEHYTAWNAAKACFAAWLADRGGAGDQEESKVIDHLCHLIETHGEGRFTRLNIGFERDAHAPRTINMLGYRRTAELINGATSSSATTYYITPSVWDKEVWGRPGLPGKRLANKILKARGVLQLDHEQKTSIKVPGIPGSARFYVFTDSDLYAARAAANNEEDSISK